MKALLCAIAAFALAACPARAITLNDCPDVSVTTCYVVDGANNVVNCCDWEEFPSEDCRASTRCCDQPPPDHCGYTTGHLYGRAVGSVAVKNIEGCPAMCFHIRTGWRYWYLEYDEWQCIWQMGMFVDQYIWKNRGEAPTTYDHTVHLGEPGYAPWPCEYWKFTTLLDTWYEKCCTIVTQ